MRRLVYYIGISIDGRIAGPGGEFDFFLEGLGADAAAYMAWVNERYPETVPTEFRAAAGLTDAPNERFDTVVMGRTTYEVGLDQGVGSPYAHLRQYVVSRSCAQVGDPTVELARDAILLVRDLKNEDGLDIWLCGGGRLAGSLLPEIDELVIKHYPVIAGSGPALVDGGFRPTAFDLRERRTFPGGVAITWHHARSEPSPVH